MKKKILEDYRKDNEGSDEREDYIDRRAFSFENIIAYLAAFLVYIINVSHKRGSYDILFLILISIASRQLAYYKNYRERTYLFKGLLFLGLGLGSLFIHIRDIKGV